MKQQPKSNEIASSDPLYSLAVFLLMAAILFSLFLAVELFQTEEKYKQITIGGSFLLGEVEVEDSGKTQD
jgi:hypothetical protein